jgi:uncharacterized protein (DUF433 family)
MATDSPIESCPRVSVEHIAIDANGDARIAGSRVKVKHIIAVKQAQGYTAEQLHAEAYPHLPLAAIYDALAYYCDHREEIDRQIKEDDETYEREWRKQQSDPEYQARVARMKARWAAREQMGG